MTHTIPDTTQHRIDKFLKSARNARHAKNAVQRDAAQGFLIERAKELLAERDALVEKLDAGWNVLAQIDAEYPWPAGVFEEQVNRAARIRREHPDYARNEERLLTWQATFEAISAALDEAADIWAGQVAA